MLGQNVKLLVEFIQKNQVSSYSYELLEAGFRLYEKDGLCSMMIRYSYGTYQ